MSNDRTKTLNLPGDERGTPPADILDSQDAAGFPAVDDRIARCPECNAIGWNTGWGYWRHDCGAEVLPDPDEGGVFAEPCGAAKEPSR